jgi:Ala-tRNA(Pro) deacylase
VYDPVPTGPLSRRAAVATPCVCDDPDVATEDLTRALDDGGVAYEVLPHAHTESAAAEADALGLAPADVAKTLVLTTPGGYRRAVIPADCRIDTHKVRDLVGAGNKQVQLASEDDMRRDYAEFELGAVPPLGGARRDPVIVDRRVADRDTIVIEAGSHDQSIRLDPAELIRAAQAEVADICKEEGR